MLRLANQNRLAASLLDRFLGSFGKLMRVDRNSSLQLSVVENLDQAILLAQQAKRDDLVQRELGLIRSSIDLSNAVKSKNGVFHAEDVREAALRQTTVQRHLAAFKAAHQLRTRAGALTLVTTGRGLTHARTHTAADTLLVFIRLLGGAEIGKITDCHDFLAITPVHSW